MCSANCIFRRTWLVLQSGAVRKLSGQTTVDSPCESAKCKLGATATYFIPSRGDPYNVTCRESWERFELLMITPRIFLTSQKPESSENGWSRRKGPSMSFICRGHTHFRWSMTMLWIQQHVLWTVHSSTRLWREGEKEWVWVAWSEGSAYKAWLHSSNNVHNDVLTVNILRL